jgi:hypothetical protein
MGKFNEELEPLFMSQMNEFLLNLSHVFYEVDFIKDGKKYIHAMNEKYLMRNWKKFIGDPYKKEIENMNVGALIKKVETIGPTLKRKEAQSQMFMQIMKHMHELSRESKSNIMLYVSNITNIVNAYFSDD